VEADLPDCLKEKFLGDLANEAERDIRQCPDAQRQLHEARLSLKLDPSAGLLPAFVDLNNKVLNWFTVEERQEIGVHTCPGGDRDSTHGAEVRLYGLAAAAIRTQRRSVLCAAGE